MSAILLLASAALAGPMETYGTIEPLHQVVHLSLDPDELAYEGTTTLFLGHSKHITETTLHATERMEITEARFVRGSQTVPATIERDGELVTITPAKPIRVRGMLPRPKRAAQGEPLFAQTPTVGLALTFSNTVNEAPYGLYRFEHDGQAFLASQFEADDAREAWPCVDLPDKKIALTLSVDVPADHVALANGPMYREEPLEDDTRKRVSFLRTRRLPTYGMALAVGPYEAIEIPDVDLAHPARVWTVPGKTDDAVILAQTVAPMLDAAEAWFGSPYPFQKLEIVAVPEFAYGGMENPGLIVLNDNMLATADQATPRGLRWMREVVAHEIGHMWFGNLVTLQWWDDFWLNESFAEWIGNRLGEQVVDADAYQRARISASQSALTRDGRATMRPVRTEVDPARIFETTNSLAYPKGEALLSMVEAWLGADVFQQGIRTYMADHAFANATAEDLFEALGEASGRDVAGMMLPWLDRPGGPLVHLEVDGNEVRWRQERFLLTGAETEALVDWQVPLHLRFATDSETQIHTALLDGSEGTFTLPGDSTPTWVFPTADGVGYLAWSLDDSSLEVLMDHAEALTGPERQALVGNLALLARAGALEGGRLLELLERFQSESDPQVLEAVMAAQGFLAEVVEEDNEPLWSAYLVRSRTPWLERIGREVAGDEGEHIPRLRSQLVTTLLEHGDDPELIAQMRAVSDAVMTDPTSVGPEAASMAVMAVAERADADFQDQMLERWKAETDPRRRTLFLAAAGAVPGDQAREKALALSLESDLSSRDAFTLRSSAFSTQDDPDAALQWLMDNYEVVMQKIPPQFQARMVYYGAGCDEDRWNKAVAFFTSDGRGGPGVDQAVREGAEGLKLCQARRDTHAKSVLAYLQRTREDQPETTP